MRHKTRIRYEKLAKIRKKKGEGGVRQKIKKVPKKCRKSGIKNAKKKTTKDHKNN